MRKKTVKSGLSLAFACLAFLLGAQRPNEVWPSPLMQVPFRAVPVVENPDVPYIDNHQPLRPQERETLKLTTETWRSFPEVWAAYRPQLPGGFFAVVYRVLDAERRMHSFLVTYDSSWAIVDQKEIMHQPTGKDFRQSHLYPYYFNVNDRSQHRGQTQRWLIDAQGKFERFNYFHRAVERARESLTFVWVRPLTGARRYHGDGSFYDSVSFAESMRVVRYSDLSPSKAPSGSYYKVILDYSRFLRNAQVPREGDSVAYIRKSEIVPPVAHHTDYSGKTYAGPDKHYSRLVSYSINPEPFLEIDSVGLEQFALLKSETVAQERYKLGEKKQWTLRFNDGSQRLFKDSTYQSEYSPTSYYRLFHNQDVPEHHLIYAPFFEDSYFFLLSGEDGDTLYRFLDYPFYSPQKKLAVSMSVPFTYDVQEAMLELVMLRNGSYSEAIHLTFVNWNFASDREIHWLSDHEFLIAVTAPHQFHQEEPKPFYLKFTFNPAYFE